MATTIELKRAEAVTRLGELNKITPPKYSARDLHLKRGGRQMIQRTGRKADTRHQVNVMAQKKKLIKDIKDIDIYLQSVKDYEASIPTIPSFPVSPTTVTSVVPVAPVITFGLKPVLRKTRIKRYTQRRRFR